VVDGGEPGVDSRDEGKHTGRNDLLFVYREDDVDGRASVTKDEEQVLRSGHMTPEITISDICPPYLP